MIALLAAVLLAVPAPSSQPSPAPVVDFEAGTAHENLTRGYPAWSKQYLRITRKTADREVLYAELSSNNRFAKCDDQFLLGAFVPLSERWMASAEGSASNTHYVLPAESIYGGVTYASGGAWYESMGLRHTDYAAASVNSTGVTIEHYWYNYRANYSVTAANLAGLGMDVEHAVELDRYYGKRNSSVGIGYTAGREIDSVGPAQLVTSRVHGWNVSGRHWMNATWAVVYGGGTFAQGTFYTRTGGRVGLDYRF